jgi:hypothetical protein
VRQDIREMDVSDKVTKEKNGRRRHAVPTLNELEQGRHVTSLKKTCQLISTILYYLLHNIITSFKLDNYEMKRKF